MPRTDRPGSGSGAGETGRRETGCRGAGRLEIGRREAGRGEPRRPSGAALAGLASRRWPALLVLLLATGLAAAAGANPGEPPQGPAPEAEAGAGPAGDGAATPGEALLDRVSEPFFRLSTFRAEFVQTQEWVGMDDPSFFQGNLYLHRPNRFRIEYTEPAGHLQVCDGERVFTYVPENEQVLVTRLPEEGGADLLGRILAESEPDPVVERSELDGRPVQILSLRPPDGLELERVRLWTREGSGAILQYELTEVSGNRSVYRFLKTWDDPDLDPELFRFEAPPGIPVVEVG